MNKNFILSHQIDNCTLNIEVDVKDDNWLAKLDNLGNLILPISKLVLEKLNVFSYASCIEFSLILADNSFIHNLNAKYRKIDKPTNCLTFPSENLKPNKLTKKTFLNGYAVLGDIIFSYAIIEQEVKYQNKSFNDHLTHLLVHSLLHFFGYDHKNEAEAEVMEGLEVEILKTFNIKSPYHDNY